MTPEDVRARLLNELLKKHTYISDNGQYIIPNEAVEAAYNLGHERGVSDERERAANRYQITVCHKCKQSIGAGQTIEHTQAGIAHLVCPPAAIRSQEGL